MTDKHVLQASGLPRGETQHKKKKKSEQKNSAAGSVCLPDVTALYIVFESVDYRHIVFIISHRRL